MNKDGQPTEIIYEDWKHPWDKNYDTIEIFGPDLLNAWPAKIIEPHCDADIAVLETAADLYPVNGIREFDGVNIGEPVYALGAPRGLAGTFTPGNVSNKFPQSHFAEIMPKVDLVISSAPITAGNSGGGLFDQYGNLIALNESESPELNGLYFAVGVYQIMLRSAQP